LLAGDCDSVTERLWQSVPSPAPETGGRHGQAPFALILVGGLTSAPALAPDDGQTAFNSSCRTCHTMKEGDNRRGPHLAGVVGRKAGSLPDYNYSSSMSSPASFGTRPMSTSSSPIPTKWRAATHETGITDAAQRKTIVEFPKAGC
jgi:cytochrome c